MLTYTTKQLAKELNVSRNKIDMLRKIGVLTGMKNGKGYIYPSDEIDSFLKNYKGADISNEGTINAFRKEKGL